MKMVKADLIRLEERNIKDQIRVQVGPYPPHPLWGNRSRARTGIWYLQRVHCSVVSHSMVFSETLQCRQYRDLMKQAQLGVPHSEIQVELD